jgi:hypothetical protein
LAGAKLARVLSPAFIAGGLTFTGKMTGNQFNFAGEGLSDDFED